MEPTLAIDGGTFRKGQPGGDNGDVHEPLF
jgi:hypothetical protein